MTDTGGGLLCVQCNESAGSKKGGQFVGWLGDCELLKKGSAPRSYPLLINLHEQRDKRNTDTSIHGKNKVDNNTDEVTAG
jgi:hypothetical protein